VEELKNKLSNANAELDAAFQSSRNHASELSKYKHLNDQLAEQLELIQKEKRKLSEELESTNNQLLECQSRSTDFERKYKNSEADRQTLQNELDDARDQLQLEISRNQSLLAQIEKLKLDTDKKLADKDDELDSLRSAHRRQSESWTSQTEENETRHKNDLSSAKKKAQIELEECRCKYDQLKKCKLDVDNQLKKLQQCNKVFNLNFFFLKSKHDVKKFYRNNFQAISKYSRIEF
jgi:chromosome segregation ATPase